MTSKTPKICAECEFWHSETPAAETEPRDQFGTCRIVAISRCSAGYYPTLMGGEAACGEGMPSLSALRAEGEGPEE